LEPLPLSILLLARDEERRLAALLPTLAFAREVVVVIDPATRDRSREVAARHGAVVFERDWDGFGPQRQFALAHCTEPWVLWLDADERLPEGAGAAIAEAIEPREAPDGYRLGRRTWFLGAPIRWCGWRGERVLRLFRRARARFDDAPVHERVHVSGSIANLPVTLDHLSYQSWEECRRKLVAYAAANAERARRAGRRAGPWDVALRPPLRFLRMYVLQLGVLDGARGVAVCALAAAQVFLKYAELWAGSAAPVARPGDDPGPRA
jgi:glycosyltransferase involved in cell wall biosynthesis